jgi:hypothetical protein
MAGGNAGHSFSAGVGPDHASDNRRVATEAALPESVAQDGDAVPAIDFFLRRERAADRRLHPQHGEAVGRDLLPAEVLGLGTRLAQRERAAGNRRHRLEHLLLGRPVHVALRSSSM